MKTLIKPVILCGGSGTRLWPLSRTDLPKQFIEFPNTKSEHNSLFRYAVNRITNAELRKYSEAIVLPPLIVAAKEHQFIIRGQLKGENIVPDVFLEPCPRNTAASLTMAALLNDSEDPVLVVLPSDQAIDSSKLNEALAYAIPDCEKGSIVLLGVKPKYAETGYGYIKTNKPSETLPTEVVAFVEKPNLEKAKKYLEDGHYLWNSGLFIIKASTWLKALHVCRPDIEEACLEAFAAKLLLKGGELTGPREIFEKIPEDSIDYAVMEKCAEKGISIKVIAFSGMWTDLGSWKAVYDASPHDKAGNFALGEVVQDGCSKSLMVSTSRLIVGNGVKDVAVLEMPDAILVTALSDSQNIKKLVEELRAKKIKKLKVNLISNVVGISALVCILGGITLAIDGYVYDRQNELTEIKEETAASSDINDALKVMLLKYSSLENVKNVAENELSMVYPNKDNTILIDMSKDYFSHINEEENKESFLDKIKGIFN